MGCLFSLFFGSRKVYFIGGISFPHAILHPLIVISLGIGLFFYPYSFSKFVLNRTYIISAANQRAKLVCDLDIASQLGHIIGWFFLTLITFGIAYPFYLYKTWNFALNRTHLVPS
jgi:hypothetical protein